MIKTCLSACAASSSPGVFHGRWICAAQQHWWPTCSEAGLALRYRARYRAVGGPVGKQLFPASPRLTSYTSATGLHTPPTTTSSENLQQSSSCENAASGGWMVLAPPPRTRAGGWPSSLRVDSRTRPVSCNGPRREGGQGCPSTGSALEQPSAWWLKLERRCLAAEDRPLRPANHPIIFIPSWSCTSRPAF